MRTRRSIRIEPISPKSQGQAQPDQPTYQLAVRLRAGILHASSHVQAGILAPSVDRFHSMKSVAGCRHVVVCGSFDSTSMSEFLAEVPIRRRNLLLRFPKWFASDLSFSLYRMVCVDSLTDYERRGPPLLSQFFHPDHGSGDDMCDVVILGQVNGALVFASPLMMCVGLIAAD